MSDRDRLRRRLFGSRSMAGCGANADTDRRRAFGQHSADCSAAYRDQSTTGLSALRQLVCAAISAKRDGAVSRKTLLVAAGIVLRISERWCRARRATPSPAELACSRVRPISQWSKSETSDFDWGNGEVRGLGLLSKSWESVPLRPALLPHGEKGRSSSLGDFSAPASRPGMTSRQCHSRTSTKCPAMAAAAAIAGDTRCVRPL